MKRIIQHLRTLMLVGDAAGVNDGQLLERFNRFHDEAAFEALVRRHGAMVLGVCRRILRNHHDAEDAFQATFLVLVRKSHVVRPKVTAANWLHGVAYRTALKAKARAAKTRVREQTVGKPAALHEPDEGAAEFQSVLDQELSRLSEKYRSAFVLCSLEGKTHLEAAHQIGCPEGTMSVRLMRAKQILAKRLSERGFGPPTALLAALAWTETTSASVPAVLLTSTTKAAMAMTSGAAAGLVSANVAALTQGVLQAMLMTRLKIALFVVLTVGATSIGGGSLVDLLRAGGAASAPVVDQPPIVAHDQPKEKSDLDRLQGSWWVVKLGSDKGNQLNWLGLFYNAELRFEGNQLVIDEVQRDRFALDSTTAPRTINLSLQLDSKVIKIHGIYRFSGDMLQLSLGAEGRRPTEFSGKIDSLVELKRSVDSGKTDFERLQGAWKEFEPYPNWTYVFKGDKITRIDRVMFTETGTFKLDPTKDYKDIAGIPPRLLKAIDITFTNASGKETKSPGIYYFQQDKLFLCIGTLPERPKVFNASVDEGVELKRSADGKTTIGPVTHAKSTSATNAKIGDLMSERLNTLRDLVNARSRRAASAGTSIDSFLEAHRMLLAAELDSAGTAADRAACYQRTLGRLQPIKEIFEAKFKAGVIDRATYYSILVFQLDTEIAYERAKLEAEKK